MNLTVYERVTSDGYLGDVRHRSLDEVRALRVECQHLEANLSYLRRLAQGRLDIVADASGRAAAGEPVGDLADLVARLPAAMGSHLTSPSSGRLTESIGPGPDPTLTAELDALCGPEMLAGLASRSAAELLALKDRLAAFEQEISGRRRSVFARLDALSGELARRYRDGETTVDALLA